MRVNDVSVGVANGFFHLTPFHLQSLTEPMFNKYSVTILDLSEIQLSVYIYWIITRPFGILSLCREGISETLKEKRFESYFIIE